MFVFAGLEQINKATQSVFMSDVDVTPGGRKQEVDVTNSQGPHISDQ